MRPATCPSCHGDLDHYAPDCPNCGAHLPDEAFEHHDPDLEVSRTTPNSMPRARRKWRVHLPWGLFLILAFYAGGSVLYIRHATLDSPRYAAASHLRVAEQILGKDNGEIAKVEDLQIAYANLVASLTLFPDDKWAHDELEKVEWAMRRRGQTPDPELKRKAAFLGAKFEEIQAGRQFVLPVGPRDEWDVDSVAAMPEVLGRYAIFGALAIVLLWAYKEFQNHLFRSKVGDEKDVELREHLRDLHAHRRR